MKFEAIMVSCRERAELRAATLASLAASDWDGGEVDVVVDDETAIGHGTARISHTWFRALERAAENRSADLLLLLEDDLAFNVHLARNLRAWKPLGRAKRSAPVFCSLYRPDTSHLFAETVQSRPEEN